MKTATQPTMSLSPSEAQERLSQADVLLLDVRTILEFSGSQVPGSLNLPLDALSSDSLKKRLGGKEQRSSYSVNPGNGLATQRQYWPVILPGRCTSWKVAFNSGVRRASIDQKAAVISLEGKSGLRQGHWCLWVWLFRAVGPPMGIALSGFVGAGLVFAGWTDTCGMGMLWPKRHGIVMLCTA